MSPGQSKRVDGRTREGRELRDERKARAWALRQDGWRMDQIAREVGVSPGTVSMMCFEAQTEARRAAAAERTRQIVALYEETLGSWWIGGGEASRPYRPVWMIIRYAYETNPWTGYPWWVATMLRLDSHSKTEPKGAIRKRGFHIFEGFENRWSNVYRRVPGVRGLPPGFFRGVAER